MSKGWSKGLTKETDVRIRKKALSMKKRRLDNFKSWRDEAKRIGLIKNEYPPFTKDGNLAELIGVVLGDGHIQMFPRTERLLIFSNAKNKGFVERYRTMVKAIIQKEPYVYKTKDKECIRISLYEKHLSIRLGVPCGARKGRTFPVPRWILANEEFVVRYLRGLYEAEGSESHHAGTYTHKLSFANTNRSLLDNVYILMRQLGFHPSRDMHRVQISRKEEVARATELLCFRKY